MNSNPTYLVATATVPVLVNQLISIYILYEPQY